MDPNNNNPKPFEPVSQETNPVSPTPLTQPDNDSPFAPAPRPALTTEEVKPPELQEAPSAFIPNPTETPQVVQQTPIADIPPQGGNGNRTKLIASVGGVLLLVGAVVSGVVLVRQQQNISKKAAGGKTIECPIAPANNRVIVKFSAGYIRSDVDETAAKQNPVSTFISAGNYKVSLVSYEEDHPNSQSQPKESWFVKLNNSQGATFMQTGAIGDLPDADSVMTQEVNNNLTISQDATAVLPYHAAYKDTSSPNSITPVCASFEKIEENVETSCSAVTAYDKDWNTLSSSDLTKLKAGDLIRFSVSGTTSKGSIDKAKFKINGQERTEVNVKRPGTNEFYDEYTIPAGTNSFTVTAQVHHQEQNKWY